MTDEDIRVEFYAKLENGDLGDDPLLLIGAVCLQAYINQKYKELLENPGIGATSFQGSEDGR